MYSKKFIPSRYEPVGLLLEKIQDLKVRNTLWLSLGEEELLQTRWLIYDWLKHMGIKKFYRLQIIDGAICVTRLKES